MRKRTKVYEHWEDWLDSLTPDERMRLLAQFMADREASVTHVTPDEPRPTLH